MADWWCRTDDRGERGPILPEGLKTLADHGLLKPSDPVRADGSSEWVPARRLSGLFAPPSLPPLPDGLSEAAIASPSPRTEDEPMIPFWPVPAERSPTGPRASQPWQFSLKQMLTATGLIAAACGAASLAFKSSISWLIVTGIVAAPSLLAGAVGVLLGKPKKWFVFGGIAGIVLLTGRLSLLLMVILGINFLFAYSITVGRTERDPARAIAMRQASIYRLATVCVVATLFFWLPLVFEPSGSGCRPMAQMMMTAVFIFPATVILALRAFHQIVLTWPEKRIGVKAAAAVLIPIALFVLLQWFILSVRGIVYES